MKKYLFLALLALIAITIASSTTYEQQTIVPQLQVLLKDKPFEQALSHIEFTYHEEPVSIATKGYYHFIEFFIRKSAHFFGFGLAGLFFYGLYRSLKWRRAYLYGVCTIFIIASLDEYNQTFSDGRTGMFKDVILDTCGAIFVIGMYKLIRKLFSHRSTVKDRRAI